jgi:FAD-dependent urate hydroxylase
MEDACLLAETLRTASTVAEAIEDYVSRRRPRVTWVHEESDTVAQSFRKPPGVRNAALRQYGNQLLLQRFAPLVAAP